MSIIYKSVTDKWLKLHCVISAFCEIIKAQCLVFTLWSVIAMQLGFHNRHRCTSVFSADFEISCDHYSVWLLGYKIKGCRLLMG